MVRSSVARVKPDLGRYAGVAVDIFYDHFLALHWNRYSATDLTDFSLWVYQVMGKFFSVLPPRSRRILPYMIAQNWLVSYSNLYDLERVFRGMDRRTGYKSQMGRAVEVLKTYYVDLQEEFTLFYPDLQSMVSQELLRLHRETTE
jgi:acyl carrier protein phosphodiesterase